MSASPAPAPSGPNSTTPNTGGPAPVVRRKAPKTSIFNTKKPVRKAAPARPPTQRSAPPSAPNPAPAPPTTQTTAAQDADGEWDEFPIFIRKSSLEEGLRHHALKLRSRLDEQSGKPMVVDPYDESQFTRPLRLHRRYARDKMETGEQSEADGIDDTEREALYKRRAERQAEREENQKLIAPTGGDSSKPTKKKNQKKVEEGRDESNPARQKRQQLRYEEARPWHLEDFEGKNMWAGSYESALSESSIMLRLDRDGFRMVPIEKWYQFVQTGKVKSDLTSDDIEKLMNKKVRMDRWGLGTQKANEEARREEMRRVAEQRRMRDEDDEPRLEDRAEFDADRDMLDMDWKDEFQDDDEGVLIQGDEGEDEKEIEQKLWMEMRAAGLGGTGVKEEDLDPEEEERQKQIAEEEEKKKARRLRKQLKKREHRGEYESDSDDLDSDTEEEEDEEKKKEEAAKAALPNGDKSGASSRGTNTPSGRPEKRPNPDLSDASGNESSRKKAKLNGSAGLGKAHGGARSLSPDAAKTKPRSTGGSGSGSDTDTSRPGRPKLKLRNSPPSGNTPNGSRAASPAASGSRAQSPNTNGATKSAFPTIEEVKAAIPPTGIEIKALVGLFKAKVGNRSAEFIALVKSAGVQDKRAPGRILPKA
ncbi:Rap30 74 interaction domain-containing [Lecanosticta acicola]|uniref:Rap30 74 interaction domain-containing n=1 Tax=Lecanosticta acicola TaxID=111012 RepID=A0AAI9EF59_9PEZI|nr:Rap30 74 interaction domain-containing [Lecanosticta acicola]